MIVTSDSGNDSWMLRLEGRARDRTLANIYQVKYLSSKKETMVILWWRKPLDQMNKIFITIMWRVDIMSPWWDAQRPQPHFCGFLVKMYGLSLVMSNTAQIQLRIILQNERPVLFRTVKVIKKQKKQKKTRKDWGIVPKSKRLRIHAIKFGVTSWMGFWTRKGKETSLLTESEILMGPVLYQCWSLDVMEGYIMVMKESVFALWTFTLDT